MVTSWINLIPALVGIVIPLASSAISREHLPSEVAAGLTVLLSAIAGFVSQAVASGSFSFSHATLTALVTYIVAAVARSQFWKGSTTDAKVLAFPRKLPKHGESSTHFAGVPDDGSAAA